MKRLYVIIPLLFMIACMGKDGVSGRDGRDGEDGDASIALTWVGILFNYATDDPAIPVIFFNNQYYEATPGTYSFAYESWDHSIWGGNYTLEIDEGEAGEPGKPGKDGDWFWQDGNDGEDGQDGADGIDLYYKIGLWSTGPELYTYLSPYKRILPPTDNYRDSGAEQESSAPKVGSLSNIDPYIFFDYETPLKTLQSRTGKFKVTLRYRRIPLQQNPN